MQIEKKEDKKIKIAISFLVSELYKLSVELYEDSIKFMADYRKEKGLNSEEPIDSEIVKSLVEKAFKEKFLFLQQQSFLISKKIIAKVGLFFAIQAWVFVRKFLKQQNGFIQNVPIVWNPLDDHFRKYPLCLELIQKEKEVTLLLEKEELIKNGSD